MDRITKRLPLLTGAITVLAWFLISNHCILDAAFSMPVPATAIAQDECCPMHAANPPTQKEPRKEDAPVCCKNLPATALKTTRPVVSFVPPLLAILFDRHDIFGCKRGEGLSLCLDTGPPKAFSFAELVLRRSLPVHAPPSLA